MDAANSSETLVLVYVYYATWHIAKDCAAHPVYVRWHHFSSSIDCSAKDVYVVRE